MAGYDFWKRVTESVILRAPSDPQSLLPVLVIAILSHPSQGTRRHETTPTPDKDFSRL